MWFLWGVLCGPGLASGPEIIAERARLRQEMVTLAQKNAWGGIERKFQKLVALGGTIRLDDYLLGAQSAIQGGDALEAIERLERAIDGHGTEEERALAVDRLSELKRSYGYVNILIFLPQAPPLERPAMPFGNDARAAIAFARKGLRKDRRYLGMLPVGTYTLADVEFTIESSKPMLDVQVGMPVASGRVVY